MVWAWVAYEEDAGQGKDRPVLVVGREGDTVLGLMLSSQDYHRGDPALARARRRAPGTASTGRAGSGWTG